MDWILQATEAVNVNAHDTSHIAAVICPNEGSKDALFEHWQTQIQLLTDSLYGMQSALATNDRISGLCSR